MYYEQLMLEESFSKKNLIKYCREELGDEKYTKIRKKMHKKINKYLHKEYWKSKNDYITAICMLDIPIDNIIDTMFISVMKFNETTIQHLSNEIGNLFGDLNDIFIQIQIGADLLSACDETIYSIYQSGDDEEGLMVESLIEFSDEVKAKISMFIYQPPMLTKPMNINNNYQSGYLSWNDSVILGGYEKQHNKPVRLDVLNILNNIGFVLDEVTCNKLHISKNELDKENLDNWEQKIREENILFKFYKSKEFFFNHKLDSRQRIYSQGYHLNVQGDEYNKACINLAKYEVVELT